METLSKSIEAARRLVSTIPPANHAPTARDIMCEDVITFTPADRLDHVMDTLLSHSISGAPVVDERRRLIGMVSESDCLRVLAAEAYDGEGRARQHTVRHLMSKTFTTVELDADIYRLAQIFVDQNRRRLPVVDAGVVMGQVSRRDVIRAMRTLI